jgi:CubicO group peptidase (beta-lactamase class C family)
LINVLALCQSLPDKKVASRIHAYLERFSETGNFIGTVLVARGGRILFRQSYGMANYELRVSNSNETRYHIASVSKPFRAAAILQLQEQGRLSVSDQVSRYVTDFPNGDRIDLIPSFGTKLSMISAKERGSGYVEDQAHRGADHRGAETTGSGT